MGNSVVKIDSIKIDKIKDIESLVNGLRDMATAIKADSIRAQIPAGQWVCDIVVRKKKK